MDWFLKVGDVKDISRFLIWHLVSATFGGGKSTWGVTFSLVLTSCDDVPSGNSMETVASVSLGWRKQPGRGSSREHLG